MLREVDKKIIVFVDDLDRLSQNEILQVLKLIRNTANFRNVIFVVAMDKEYIISRLKSSDDILNTKFIDKFFQLEVYLPEIQSNILRDYFKEELNKPFDLKPLDFESKLDNAINNQNLLFNDYITNFRDAKRVINQIRFDLSLYKDDYYYLNLKDFINFTFFKLKFPKVMKDLNENRTDFLSVDKSKGIYNLLKEESRDDDVMSLLNTQYFNDISAFKKYTIYNKLLNDKCETDLSINCEDKKLLIKTLAYLFGEENTVEETNSIKYESNFRMLMQQRIFKNHLRHSEFEELMALNANLLSVKIVLKEFHDSGKIIQLIDRLKYYNTTNENSLKQVILVLAILFEKRDEYGTYLIDLLYLINKFVQELYQGNTKTAPIVEWVKESIFSNLDFPSETRLALLGHLWESKTNNNLWYLDEDYINSVANSAYTEYMDRFQGILWDVNDYNIYGMYHIAKQINKDMANAVFINFWKINHIELLCAQLIELDAFSDRNFKIADITDEIFGSRISFIDFVRYHVDSNLPVIKEFLHFFNLMQIINFSTTIIFEFGESELMRKKVDYIKSHPNWRNNEENIEQVQVFIETNDLNLSSSVLTNNILSDKNILRRFVYNRKDYMIIITDKNNFEDQLREFFSYISRNNYKPDFIFLTDNLIEGFTVTFENQTYLKIISIQPPFKKKGYEVYET